MRELDGKKELVTNLSIKINKEVKYLLVGGGNIGLENIDYIYIF